ncbi:hypothetical protein HN51_005822 [Arachis hypogaea]
MAANLGVVTGKHLAEHCRNEYPWATNFILWFIAEIAIVACNIPEGYNRVHDFKTCTTTNIKVRSMIGNHIFPCFEILISHSTCAVIGTAFALSMLFNIPVWIGVLLTGLSTLILLALQQYGVRKLEFLIAFLVFTIAACFFAELGYAKPIAKEVLKGLFVPELKGSGATGLAISLLGAMIIQYTTHCMMISSGCKNLEILCFIGMLQPTSHYEIRIVVTEFYKDIHETKMFESQLNVKNLEDEISNKDMNLSPILKSIKELEKAAIKINDQRKEIEASKGWRTWKKYQMKVRDMNDRLMMAERAFTDRDGLLGMTWHKHLKPSKQSREETSNMATTVGITKFIGAEMIEKAIS